MLPIGAKLEILCAAKLQRLLSLDHEGSDSVVPHLHHHRALCRRIPAPRGDIQIGNISIIVET